MTDLNNRPKKPMVTFALFAYNQEDYIRAAVEGAFAQTYQPLEIILSDDCSTDRTFEIMQEMAMAYNGPHVVYVRSNQVNLGIGPHVNMVVDASNGIYIAFAAGDDISSPERISHAMEILSIVKTASDSPLAYSILSALTLIDEEGNVYGERPFPNGARKIITIEPSNNIHLFEFNDLMEGKLSTSGPSRIISKHLHTFFGEINAECFTEDIIYLFRSVLAGTVLYSEAKTVFYRKHRKNLSESSTLYAKSFTGVEKQLRADLDKAFQADLISEQENKLALGWINFNIALRAFYKTKLSGRRPQLKVFICLIKAKNLSYRRKFGILREYLGVR
ncbi:MAG: glycosyltransferase [Sedimentisphaerales bacterium]|nr:glycosyltransferase [Sedimentisphaerales bacterium]